MKRTLALFCAAALLLTASGCKEEQPAITSESSAESTQTAETTETAEATETAEQTTASTTATAPAEKLPQEFMELTLGDMSEFGAWLKDGNRQLLDDWYVFHFSDIVTFTNGCIGIDEELKCYRQSTCALKSTEAELMDMVNKQEYSEEYSGSYTITEQPHDLYISVDDKGRAQLDSLSMKYSIYDAEITLAGFLKYGSGDMYRFIVDPAYAMELPLLTSRPEYMYYNINGREVYADTLCFIVSEGLCDFPDNIRDDYVYAKLTLYDVDVTYNTVSGYLNQAIASSIEVLTEDTDSVIDYPLLFDGEVKDPAMAEVYNAITDNIDSFYKETTHGIQLLDLDFDGTPELLVSDAATEPVEELKTSDYNVSVYRIENGGLRYIDKMTVATDYFTTGMVLGLKTLEDGSKGWYISSCINRETGARERIDYIYTLEGDTLKATEKFRMDGEGNYYIDGEQITMTTREEYVSFYDEEPELTTCYEWGEYSSFFGPDIVFGDIKHAYVADITEQYLLLSEWLCHADYQDELRYARVDSIPMLTGRELSYRIAYLVDSVFLGGYNPAKQQYYYEFYGAFAKPVIYLYPETETDVTVEVSFADGGQLTCTYPEYNGGWRVTALPDGTLYDESGNEYYCLYWEGEGSAALDMSRGWCVKGEDTAEFLREKLMHIGLSAREANEFIIYWLPQMQDNAYNVISLHTEEYAAAVPLEVTPAPDSVIRVFMTFAPSDGFVEIQPQELPAYERKGFTLVEWGGAK